MKNFITMLACFLILIVFILQLGIQQKNYYTKSKFQNIVYSAADKAKKEGCFTDSIIQEIKTKIENEINIDESDIEIDVTLTPKYRVNEYDERELIYYKVSIPINKLVAAATFLGITDEENQSRYEIEGYTSSERLK